MHTKKDFDRAFANRTRASDNLLTVYLSDNETGEARLGIAVGRRYGNAVQRNRIKRLVREGFRLLRLELPPGSDWVVVPRPAPPPAFRAVLNSLRCLTRQLAGRRRTGTPDQGSA